MKKSLLLPVFLSFIVFLCFTVSLSVFDCGYAGFHPVRIGYSELNKFVDSLFLHSEKMCRISDFITVICSFFSVITALYGLCIILRCGISYDVAIKASPCAVFLFLNVAFRIFCTVPVNFSPDISDVLNSSFPAYNVLIPVGVLETVIINIRYFSPRFVVIRILLFLVSFLFCIASVICSLLGGKYWATDIAGAFMLASSVVLFWNWLCTLTD